MAKKVQPVDILPAPSSSDEETQDDENGSSSDTDDEQTPQHPQLFQKPINQESQNEESDESGDETEDDEPESKIVPFVKKPSLQESDDESDDDSDETLNSPSASAFAVEPIVSKPVSKSPEPKTPTSKPARVKSRAKRPADSEDTDKGIKAVSKNEEPGNVKGGNGKRPAEVEVEKVERSKKSKVSNGEGQSVGKVEKGSKSKKGASGDDESGKVEEKKSVVKWSEKDEADTDKGIKAVSKNQQPDGGSWKRPTEVEVEKVERSKKSKVSNGEGQSVGKVEKGSKSKKGASGDDESGEVEEKKSVVKWSEKDEAALLGGIIDYKAVTGEDVNSKVDSFYEYVKDLISVSLMKTQLHEKIRRLKKKFKTNVDKCQNGEEPVFSKPHESKLFELSQKIWGGEGTVTEGNDSKGKSSKKKDKKDGNEVGNTSTPVEPVTSRELSVSEVIKDTIIEEKKEENQYFWSLYPRLCASLESEAAGYLSLRVVDLKEYVKGIISGLGEEKARELEDGWKAFHVMDHQLYAKRAHLISKQAQVVCDLLNQS